MKKKFMSEIYRSLKQQKHAQMNVFREGNSAAHDLVILLKAD